MLSIVGIYQNGLLKLDKDFTSTTPVKVIVTFLEEVQSKTDKGITLKDFSFSKSKQNLENFKGSFADTVVDERRENEI